MLTDTRDLEPDAMARFKRWYFSEPIAECPETGTRLQANDGRRKAGRPRRYYVTSPRTLLPAGLFDQDRVFGLTAHTDSEAIEKANKRLAAQSQAALGRAEG